MKEKNGESTWTPLKIIQWGIPYLTQKGIRNAKLDSETIVAHALQMDRLKVYLQFDRPLDAQELLLIRNMFKRRAQHEPIQYITEKREFFGIPLKVGPGVLIPRPETELIVEQASLFLKKIPEEKRQILDLGTGSGCIALALAKSIPCKIWAVDSSLKALEIARENARNLGMDKVIQWRHGDWFMGLLSEDPERFQMIVSNPPYIALSEREELDPEVRNYEPMEALFSGESGLEAYEAIGKDLAKKMASGGAFFVEIHSNQYDKVSKYFQDFGFQETLFRDIQGLPRVLQLTLDRP
jgi:release factor glutamine methyltransferase